MFLWFANHIYPQRGENFIVGVFWFKGTLDRE